MCPFFYSVLSIHDGSHKQQETVLELKVYMHCKACERSVHNTLRKLEGIIYVSATRLVSIYNISNWIQ